MRVLACRAAVETVKHRMSKRALEALATALTITGLLVLAPVAGASLSVVTTWGGPGTGQGQFSVPLGVVVDPSGNVYVADENNNRVEKFDSSGRFLLQFGSPGSGPGQFNGPGHLALDPQGNVIVSDEGGYRVEKFSPAGTFLLQYGRFGKAPGQFGGNTRGVAADDAGNVYVAYDGQPGQIVKFTAAGSYITSWPAQAPGAPTPRSRSIAFDPSGVLYVADEGDGSIDKFAADGRFGAQGATGWNAPSLAPWLETALNSASQAHYGAPCGYIGQGGTIPLMSMLPQGFPAAQMMVCGVLGPKSNAHGPNEFLHVPYGKKLTAAVAQVMAGCP
jgi:sugar lactone lactonase YvrE